jgi:hypothetical protein
MAFDHEKLDVYRLAVLFSSWVGERLEGSLKKGKQLLERIVSMLWRMIESQQSNPDHSTRMSTMTIASTSTSTRAVLPKRDR